MSSPRRILVLNRGGPDGIPRSVPSSPALSLLSALLREGVPIRHDCGGKARCGTCRIRVVSGARALSPVAGLEAERLAALGAAGVALEGVRLACQASSAGDIEIVALLDAGAPGGPGKGAGE